MPFVLDASVALSWCFEDEAGADGDAVLEGLADDVGVVPGIWPFEVSSGLVVAGRRGRLTPAQVVRFARLLTALRIEVEPADLGAVLAAVLPVARDHGLSAYDAAYIEVAARRGIPLATRDQRLRAAARAAGVPIRG